MANKQQERELLRLQTELLRLKIRADELKRQRALAVRQKERLSWEEGLGLLENLSSAAALWKTAKPVAGKKSRVLLAAAWLAWKYFNGAKGKAK